MELCSSSAEQQHKGSEMKLTALAPRLSQLPLRVMTRLSLHILCGSHSSPQSPYICDQLCCHYLSSGGSDHSEQSEQAERSDWGHGQWAQCHGWRATGEERAESSHSNRWAVFQEIENSKKFCLQGAGKAFSAGGDLNWLLARHRDTAENNISVMQVRSSLIGTK